MSREIAALLQTAAQWQAAGDRVAMATVIKTWRSAPRPVGARLLIHQNGEFAGSVSGGCVEKEVIHAATACFADGTPRRLSFGVADEMAWQSGLSCGGEIEIFVALLPSSDSNNGRILAQLQKAIATRTHCELKTNMTNGDIMLTDKTTAAPLLDGDFFIEPFPPCRRLLLIGATHIAQVLAPMARTCGFDTLIIDPREAWATAARFPDTPLDTHWPEDVLPDLLDAQTAVAALTHDPKIDDGALLAALSSPVRYVGALGSSRTHAKRRARLLAAGADEESLSRLCAPIGLDIGANSAAEIAVSVMGEIVAAFNKSD